MKIYSTQSNTYSSRKKSVNKNNVVRPRLNKTTGNIKFAGGPKTPKKGSLFGRLLRRITDPIKKHQEEVYQEKEARAKKAQEELYKMRDEIDESFRKDGKNPYDYDSLRDS